MLPLQLALTAVCLLSRRVARRPDRPRPQAPGRVLLNVLAVAELALVVHLVLGIVRVTGDVPRRRLGVGVHRLPGRRRPVIPAGVVWSSGERSRGGTAVLLVAVLLVPFMFVRLADIWAAGG